MYSHQTCFDPYSDTDDYSEKESCYECNEKTNGAVDDSGKISQDKHEKRACRCISWNCIYILYPTVILFDVMALWGKTMTWYWCGLVASLVLSLMCAWCSCLVLSLQGAFGAFLYLYWLDSLRLVQTMALHA